MQLKLLPILNSISLCMKYRGNISTDFLKNPLQLLKHSKNVKNSTLLRCNGNRVNLLQLPLEIGIAYEALEIGIAYEALQFYLKTIAFSGKLKILLFLLILLSLFTLRKK